MGREGGCGGRWDDGLRGRAAGAAGGRRDDYSVVQLVGIDGIVTRCSQVRSKLVSSTHYCAATGKTITREYRDATAIKGAPTSNVYPTKDEDGNLLTTEYGLCVYQNHQTSTMQEVPSSVPSDIASNVR